MFENTEIARNENSPTITHYFSVKNVFSKFHSKNGCRNEFKVDNEKFAADPNKEFPRKSILQQFRLTSLIRQRRSK